MSVTSESVQEVKGSRCIKEVVPRCRLDPHGRVRWEEVALSIYVARDLCASFVVMCTACVHKLMRIYCFRLLICMHMSWWDSLELR